MMHSTLHFTLGMVVGAALTGRPLWHAWHTPHAPLAAHLRRWLVVTYAVGLFAIIPNLLRRAGLPHDLSESAIMNLFLLAPLLNRLVQGGAIIGPFLLGSILATQYGVLIAALIRARNIGQT